MMKQGISSGGSILPFPKNNSQSIIENRNGFATSVATKRQPELESVEAVQEWKMISTRPWDLTKPQYDNENYYRYRAQSILTGMEFQDGSKHAPILPIEQALDIVNWNWDTGRTL